MSASRLSQPAPVAQIETHPPERRQRNVLTTYCGCCCCCCCCLHTVGGLIGAAVGSVPVRGPEGRYEEEDFLTADEPLNRATWGPKVGHHDEQAIVRGEDQSGVAKNRSPEEYTSVGGEAYSRYYRKLRVLGNPSGVSAVLIYWLTVAGIAMLIVGYAALRYPGRQSWGGSLCVLLGFGPAIQLAAAGIAAIVVGATGGGNTGMRQIGKITLYTISGTLIGIVLMFMTCMGFSFLR